MTAIQVHLELIAIYKLISYFNEIIPFNLLIGFSFT